MDFNFEMRRPGNQDSAPFSLAGSQFKATLNTLR